MKGLIRPLATRVFQFQTSLYFGLIITRQLARQFLPIQSAALLVWIMAVLRSPPGVHRRAGDERC